MTISSDQHITDNILQTLARQAADDLSRRRWKLVTAESCTGGWLAKICTDISGSSEWFAHGIVSYSNASKMQFLGVPDNTLKQNGAVSEPTVIAMALGATRTYRDYLGVSVSGIAGPGGGSENKPVGTVCFGFALGPQAVKSCTQHFTGDRDSIRRQSVAFALQNISKIARA